MRFAIIVLVGQLVACSSDYMPRRPNHVAIVIQNGRPVYVRDGQTFEPGLGGGLVDAVHGNRAAVAAAEEFRSRQITGVAATVLGVVAMLGGATWAGVAAANDRPNSQLAAPIALAIGGVVAMLVGTFYFASAPPHQWDAINIYNDGAEPAPTLKLAPPGYTSSRESLRMR
ncbi:MAG TPA: hypothetical protein VGG28_29795 [Kofleriaceae bacterium]|jgi:hypothetical protein